MAEDDKHLTDRRCALKDVTELNCFNVLGKSNNYFDTFVEKRLRFPNVCLYNNALVHNGSITLPRFTNVLYSHVTCAGSIQIT